MDNQEFIYRTKVWPCWPLLPLKRPGPDGSNECGILIDDSLEPVPATVCVVYMTNMFDLVGRTGNLSTDFLTNATVARIEYTSVEAILADGWIVD